MPNALITGWGRCTPPTVVTNHDLSQIMDTSDEWIVSRTGISERRVSHVPLSELAEVAAWRALDAAGRKPEDVGMIILNTASPDYLIPSAASRLQVLLGCSGAAVFDVNAACCGFVYGLNLATSAIRSGDQKTVLVIGADMITWFLDWTARDTGVLFGDGAAAAVVEAHDGEAGVLGTVVSSDAGGHEVLKITNSGTDRDRSVEPVQFGVQFDGREIFKRAVKGMSRACEEVLAKTGMRAEDVDWVIPHQANLRIIEALAHRFGIPDEKLIINIQKYGNTSAGSIPIALCEAVEDGRIQPGQTLLMPAFGAGLTCAAAVVKWGERVTPIGHSEAELPPTDLSGLELLASAIERSRRLRKLLSEGA